VTNELFTIQELIGCAQREISKRQHVYHRLVMNERMTPAQAQREIALMSAILANLENQISPSLF
jgi:hypothetical protein